MRLQANSPEKASKALINSNVSHISVSDILATEAPRFGEISINPSAASTFKASRKGVREIPKVSHSSRSFNLMPGTSTASTIRLRKCSTTVSCSRCRASFGTRGDGVASTMLLIVFFIQNSLSSNLFYSNTKIFEGGFLQFNIVQVVFKPLLSQFYTYKTIT